MNKRGQSAVEYLIIIGFVSIAVTSILVLAYFYANVSNDKIKTNQMEAFATKIITRAESVFYSGEPAQLTFSIYIPKGVSSISLQGRELIVTAHISSGDVTRVFLSRVNLEGTISPNEGAKNLIVRAYPDKVVVL